MDTERKNDIKAAAKRTEAQGPFSDRSLSRAVFSTLRMCALCIRYKSILAVAGQSAPTARLGRIPLPGFRARRTLKIYIPASGSWRAQKSSEVCAGARGGSGPSRVTHRGEGLLRVGKGQGL